MQPGEKVNKNIEMADMKIIEHDNVIDTRYRETDTNDTKLVEHK